jgi:hypothetical protein
VSACCTSMVTVPDRRRVLRCPQIPERTRTGSPHRLVRQPRARSDHSLARPSCQRAGISHGQSLSRSPTDCRSPHRWPGSDRAQRHFPSTREASGGLCWRAGGKSPRGVDGDTNASCKSSASGMPSRSTSNRHIAVIIGSGPHTSTGPRVSPRTKLSSIARVI